jgi:hypothetical protein
MLPPVLRALGAWLRDAGFTEADGVYTRPPLRITFGADRIDIAHVSWPDEGYDTDVWTAALDQVGTPLVPTSLEVQADVLRDRLDEIAAREDLREQLSAIAVARS